MIQTLLESASVHVLPEGSHFFSRGDPCDGCVLILQGRVHVVTGSERFECERGPWSVLAAPALTREDYAPDFDAAATEPSRILQISRAAFLSVLRSQPQQLERSPRRSSLMPPPPSPVPDCQSPSGSPQVMRRASIVSSNSVGESAEGESAEGGGSPSPWMPRGKAPTPLPPRNSALQRARESAGPLPQPSPSMPRTPRTPTQPDAV